MKSLSALLISILLFATKTNAQNSATVINAKDGKHYITTDIDYPITGKYLFQETSEPIVELNANGTGIYQLHDQPQVPMVWGIECDENGEPKFIKGFDSAAYTLWHQNESPSESGNNQWIAVEFSIHFETEKMYIQGERVKNYSDSTTSTEK